MAGPPWTSTSLMLCAAALAAGHAAAAEPGGPDELVRAQLELVAPEGCGTDQELAARVSRRTSRIEIVASGSEEPGDQQIRAVKAEIVRAGEHWLVASMSVAQPDGKLAVRRFRSRTCSEALDALGLVIAITLDPGCALAAELPAADAPPQPPPPLPPATVSTAATAAPASTPVHRIELGAALTGHALSGAGPRVMPGLSIQLALALEREALLSPAVRLSLIHVSRDGYVADGGSAGFALDSAAVDLCPVRLRSWRLTARPCGAAVVGRLRAHGTDTFLPESHDRLFVTLGGNLVLTARATRYVEVLGTFGAAAPLIRDSFQFSPAVFHRVSAVTWAAALGVGAIFP